MPTYESYNSFVSVVICIG